MWLHWILCARLLKFFICNIAHFVMYKMAVLSKVKKRIDNDEEKVRDHCHVTGKFRGATHGSCNINLQLTKNVPVIFQNLRGYNSHLIYNELDKFDVQMSVISNGLAKYMAFFWIKT